MRYIKATSFTRCCIRCNKYFKTSAKFGKICDDCYGKTDKKEHCKHIWASSEYKDNTIQRCNKCGLLGITRDNLKKKQNSK